MLAGDLQPASIFEDKGFLNFLRVIDSKYQPPSRRSIMRSLLPDQYQTTKQELKAKLAEIKWCALTTDLWTTQGYTVADLGGVRGVQMHLPLVASNVFLRT